VAHCFCLLSPGRTQRAGGRTGGGAGNTLLEVWNRSETRHIAVTSAFRGFARATAGKGLVVTYGTDPVEKRESSVYDGMKCGLGRAMQMRECLSWHEDMGLVRLADSASHNSIFLSRKISPATSQPASQQYFPLTRNQPDIQPASQPNKAMGDPANCATSCYGPRLVRALGARLFCPPHERSNEVYL